jgi:uncharacterized protein (TIGR01370 family)
VPQNGSRILDFAAHPTETLPPGRTREAVAAERVQAYMDAIDGLGIEDTFYFGDLSENNALNVQSYAIEGIRKFKEKGKAILAIDYLSAEKPNPKGLKFPDAIDDFYRRARAEGFIPYASTRTLDSLARNPSQPPLRSPRGR